MTLPTHMAGSDTNFTSILLENASVRAATTSNGYRPTFQEFWHSSYEYSVYWALKSFIPPIFVVVGLVGNCMVIVALRQNAIRSSSIGYYFMLLLSCYIVALVSTCGLEWISYISNTTQMTNSSDSMCRICQFVYGVINHSPYWIIALMLADRTVYVCLPLHSSQFCTVFVAKLLTIFMFVALFTVSIHSMWTYELSTYGCSLDPGQRDFFSTVWPWISATMNCYLPLLVIHVLFFTVLVGLVIGRSQDHGHSAHRHVSVALLVALSFIAFTSPSVYLNLIQYSKPSWLGSYQSYARLYLLMELFQTLVWLNMALTHLLCWWRIPKLRLRSRCRSRFVNGHQCVREEGDHDGMLMLQTHATVTSSSTLT